MSCEILIRATAHSVWAKGDIVDIRDSADLIDHPWGNAEGLPDFVQLEITDASKAQVDNYLKPFRTGFGHEILAQNAQGYRVKVSVNPKVWQLFGSAKAVRVEVRDFLVDEYNATVFARDTVNQEWATFDIPKPVDLQQVKDEVLDLFEESLGVSRYYFASSDVDLAIAAGGRVSLNKTQAQSKLIDRLE